MKAIFSTLLAAASTSLFQSANANTMKEVSPGVFSLPLKKQYTGMRHPHLEHGSPLVGNWEEAEMWNYEVKEPITNIDHYMYIIDCSIGDVSSSAGAGYDNHSQCIFDTTTSVSSTLAQSYATWSTKMYYPTYSTTSKDLDVLKSYWTMGLYYQGTQYTDTWCLGGGDVHITVCNEDQRFVYVTKNLQSSNRQQWKPPLANYPDITAVIGLGQYPQDEADTYNFINNAYQQGYLASNQYSFQGVYDEDEQYAHVTIGGYNVADMGSEIEWFNMTDFSSVGWRLNITNMTMNGDINLLTQTTTKAKVIEDTGFYEGANEVTVLPSYAHFNSGYPFIGVDSNVGAVVQEELEYFRPDLTCTYDAVYNPWNICYYSEPCQAADMPGNITFAFGTNATFSLPMSQLQINYTINTLNFCGIGVQTLPKMQYVFDIAAEQHFYFGDLFFKQFVGVFDQGNGMLGMAKSARASSSAVTFECTGAWCQEPVEEDQASDTPPEPVEPTPEPDPPTPDPPAPDPPEPVDPTDPTDPTESDNMIWIWIIVGLGILTLIAIFFAIYYYQQSRKKDKWAAIQYANQTGNDGDLIERDIEKYSGKGDNRVSQFADHDDLLKTSGDIVEDEPIPTPYALQ